MHCTPRHDERNIILLIAFSYTMTSIVELFPKCRKLAYDSRQQLSQVQNGVFSPSELFLSLDELERQLDIMQSLVSKETPAQRQVWKRKILELREDSSSLRRQGEHYDRMVHSNVLQQRERNELLTRRKNRAAGAESDYQNYAQEAQSLDQSQLMVGDLLSTGEASLTGLVQQRQQMRGIKRRVFDMGNKLGISNSTMRIIERRDITDAYLVFGGMVVTCIVIYFCWFHF
jgi:Golgi SNAP receptor complex protein 2